MANKIIPVVGEFYYAPFGGAIHVVRVVAIKEDEFAAEVFTSYGSVVCIESYRNEQIFGIVAPEDRPEKYRVKPVKASVWGLFFGGDV